MNDHAVAQALGDLQGTVRSMAEQWRRQEDAAVASRRALYERVEGFSTQIGKMSGQIEGVTQDVAEMKKDIDDTIMPTINSYKTGVAHRVGFMSAGKMVWGLILGVCTIVGFIIHEVLQYLGHSPFHP